MGLAPGGFVGPSAVAGGAQADDPAAQSAPQSPADLLSSVRRALADGDTARALSLATAAVEAAPDQPQGYALKAAVHDARREWADAVSDYTQVLFFAPTSVPAWHRRGEAHFRLGMFKQSVADFDEEIRLAPDRDAHHWQRGLSLYYAGDYARGVAQFELHRTVNPDDVENAAWHYLCVAREQGVAAARAALIPITPGADTRVPMTQIHALYAGKGTPETVLAAAREGDPDPEALKGRMLYAHLYLGLHHEAAGETNKAKQHITLAAEKYATDGDYMSDTARVHARTLAPAKVLRTAADFPSAIGHKVEATGVAHQSQKGGASLTLADRPLYIHGLQQWPAELLGKRLNLTGRLEPIPDPPPGHAGLGRGAYRVAEAKWEVAE